MAPRDRHILPEPPRIHADDLFPDWGEDVDRRIAASEARIKFWVLGGVITNLIVAVAAAIPVVFFMGQISRDIAAGTDSQKVLAIAQTDNAEWRQRRMVWEARVEAELKRRGVDIEEIP